MPPMLRSTKVLFRDTDKFSVYFIFLSHPKNKEISVKHYPPTVFTWLRLTLCVFQWSFGKEKQNSNQTLTSPHNSSCTKKNFRNIVFPRDEDVSASRAGVQADDNLYLHSTRVKFICTIPFPLFGHPSTLADVSVAFLTKRSIDFPNADYHHVFTLCCIIRSLPFPFSQRGNFCTRDQALEVPIPPPFRALLQRRYHRSFWRHRLPHCRD